MPGSRGLAGNPGEQPEERWCETPAWMGPLAPAWWSRAWWVYVHQPPDHRFPVECPESARFSYVHEPQGYPAPPARRMYAYGCPLPDRLEFGLIRRRKGRLDFPGGDHSGPAPRDLTGRWTSSGTKRDRGDRPGQGLLRSCAGDGPCMTTSPSSPGTRNQMMAAMGIRLWNAVGNQRHRPSMPAEPAMAGTPPEPFGANPLQLRVRRRALS